MFDTALKDAAADVAACFDRLMAPLPDLPVTAAMRYATSGGKGLRGFLVLETARLHGVHKETAIYAAAAVEALHAYSLVHDDLPCMDDDDLRRGQPTVHVKWDQATAVLAGDALQTLAFEALTHDQMALAAPVKLALIASLAKASGAGGMVLGQALDIAAETAKTPLTLDQITHLQDHKTGALICWSAEAGARMAGADTAPMRQYAHALGLAFQIADDIMDVEGDAGLAGKRLGKDADAGKATFVSLLGLDRAKQRSVDLVEQAQDALAPFGAKADNLRQAARFVIVRKM